MSGGRLERRLGLRDATVLGVGSMLGAGVFAVWAPAAGLAGDRLLLALALAAVVALANGLSTAHLAAAYPTSGGAYVYGRERLGPWWGFLAGWCFVVGKTASCAAMALTLAAYLAPQAARPVAAVAVVAVVGVTLRGVTRTARLTLVLVLLTLAALTVVVVAAVAGDVAPPGAVHPTAAPGPAGVLGAAGLLFFAFAGYARVATLGEEVRDPARTVPRAVVLALAVVLAVYLVVGTTALRTLGATTLAASSSPLVAVVRAAGADAWVPVVVAGAVAASAGALLGLVTGVGRTTLAMARDGELPRRLARVDAARSVPVVAQAVLGAVLVVLVLVADLRGAIGFSSAGVLLYYAVANAAALRGPAVGRRLPRVVPVVGLVGCLALVGSLPTASLLGGLALVAAGVLVRVASRCRRRRRGATMEA